MAPHVIKNRLLPYKVLVHLLYRSEHPTTPLDLEAAARQLKITPSRLRDALRWLSTSGWLDRLSIDGKTATVVPRLPVIWADSGKVSYTAALASINDEASVGLLESTDD